MKPYLSRCAFKCPPLKGSSQTPSLHFRQGHKISFSFFSTMSSTADRKYLSTIFPQTFMVAYELYKQKIITTWICTYQSHTKIRHDLPKIGHIEFARNSPKRK